MPTAGDRFPALRMTAAGIIAGRRREPAWRWRSRQAALLANRDIPGDTTKAGSGWITDAGLTSGWSSSGRGKIAEANRLFAARRMTEGGTTARRTRAEMWT